MEQLNNLLMCFSNKETINRLMSTKNACIKKKAKGQFIDIIFFLISYLKLENSTLLISKSEK